MVEFSAKLTADALTKFVRELEGAGQDVARAINQQLGGTVTKTLVLETRVKDGKRQLVGVEKEYLSVVDNIRKAQKKLDATEIGSTTNLRQSVNEAKKARDGIVKYLQAAEGISIVNPKWEKQNQKVQELNSQLRKVDGSGFWDRLKGDLGVGQILSFSNGLSQIVNGFQAVSIVVGQIIGSINSLTDALAKLQGFSLAFQAIGAGAAGAQQALSESSRIALNLGVGLQTVRDGFQQLSPVVLNSGGTIEDVSGIMEALSSRFAAFGISGDKARRVTNGIIQAFGKGKLQAEELTQQIAEADPAFGTDLAGALGVSTAELLKLVKAGEITSDVLIRILPTLSKSALLYGKLGNSASDAVGALARGGDDITITFDQVRNKIASLNQLSLEALADSAKPFLVALLGLEAAASDFFSSFARSTALDALGSALGGVVDALSTTLKAFLTAATGFLTVIEPIAQIVNFLLKVPFVSQAVGVAILAGLVAPLKTLQTTFVGTLKSGNAFVQSLAGSGGSIGAAATAISGLNGQTKGVAAASNVAVGAYAKQARSLTTLAAANRNAGLAAAEQKATLDRLNSAKAASGGQPSALTAGLDRDIAEAERKYARFTATQERAAAQTKKVTAEIGASGQALQSQGRSVAGAGDQYARLNKSLSSLQTVNAQATASLGRANAELKVLQSNGIAAAGGLGAYDNKQRELTGQVQRFSAIQESTNGRILETRNRLAGLVGQSTRSATALTRITNGFTALRGVAVTAVGAAKAAATGLASSLGTVGIVLIAVGVLQAAYASATAKSTEATEKAKISAEAFKKILKDLGSTKVEVPEPKGAELAWKSFAAIVTREINAAGKGAQAFAQATQGDFSELQKVNPFGFLERSVPILASLTNAAPFQSIIQQGIDAEGQLAAVADGVKELKEALDALKKEQATPLKVGETKDQKQVRVFTGFNKTQEQSSAIAKGLTELEEKQAALNKKYVEGGSANGYLRGKMAELDIQINAQRASLTAVQTALVKFGAEIGALSDNQINGLVSTISALGEAAKETKESLETAAPNSAEFAKFAAASAAVDAAIDRLKKKAEDPIVLKAGIDTALIENSAKIAETQSRLNKALAQGDVVNIASIRTELAALNRDRENLKEFRVELDASSINNAQEAIKRLEDKIIKVGVNAPELPGLIVSLQTAKQVLGNREFTNRNIEISFILSGLQDGTLVASAEKLQDVISLLDKQVATVSIDSPMLPGLIEQLERLKQDVTDLDGRKATLTVEVIEKGLQDRTIGRNQASLDRRAAAQQTVVNTTDSNSSNYDVEIQKFKRFEQEKKAIAMETSEIRAKFAQNQIDREVVASDVVLAEAQKQFDTFSDNLEQREEASDRAVEKEKAAIERVAEVTDRAFERRKAAIQREIALISQRYDAEIARLNELGPAEQQVENNRIANLKRTAAGGGEEGLQARADLERLERNKQIAAIELVKQQQAEAAQRKLAALEEAQQKAAEEAAAKLAAIETQQQEKKRQFEEALQAQKLEVQKLEAENEALKLEQQKQQIAAEEKARQEEDAALQKELEAREKFIEDSEKVAKASVDSADAAKNILLPAIESAATAAEKVEKPMVNASTAIQKTLLPSMEEAANQARAVVKEFDKLDGRVITVVVQQVVKGKNLWTGGPVTGGQSYTVNELGREGFMTAGGSMREINRPAYATWRAPSNGYVIPAHIWANLDAPKTGVKASQPVGRIAAKGGDSRLLGALRAAINSGDNGVKESVDRLSEVQAKQAMKIGRLSRAISELAEKDWNVNVQLPASGPQGHPNMRSRGLA